MRKLIKTYWLPAAVLLVVFFNELFNCFAIITGIAIESGMKQYEAILLAAVGYSMMASDFFRKKISKREHRIIAVLFAMLFLYMLTPVFYGGPQPSHTVYLLVFGSECIPAAYIGIRLARSQSFHKVIILLPFVVIPISLLIGTIGLTAAMMGTIASNSSGIGDEAGLNYQILSYFMAFSYTYAFYYTFYGNQKPGMINHILRMVMAVDMFYCAVVCLLGGGRGAFVYIVAITLFILFYYFKSSKKHRAHAFVITALLIIASFYVISSMDIMNSAGMGRITGKLTEDESRSELYNTAFDVFLTSPIVGRGMGSVWWTIGFYCHNLILDLLSETGLLGALFFLSVIWKSIIKLYKYSYVDKFYLFLLFVLTGELTNCMFSGYYIAAYNVYFVCAFAYCLPYKTAKLNVK